MPEAIPIIDHVLHTAVSGRIGVQILLQTAGRHYRYAVRVEGSDGRLGELIAAVPEDLAALEEAARQAREWFAAYAVGRRQ